MPLSGRPYTLLLQGHLPSVYPLFIKLASLLNHGCMTRPHTSPTPVSSLYLPRQLDPGTSGPLLGTVTDDLSDAFPSSVRSLPPSRRPPTSAGPHVPSGPREGLCRTRGPGDVQGDGRRRQREPERPCNRTDTRRRRTPGRIPRSKHM